MNAADTATRAQQTDVALAGMARVLGWLCVPVVGIVLVVVGLAVYTYFTFPHYDPQPRTLSDAPTMTCAEQTERGDTAMILLLSSVESEHHKLEVCPPK